MNRTKTVITLSADEERAIRILQLLGDTTRYKIFKLLQNEDEMCVSEIAESLNISVSAVSQHFRNFEMVGLVNKERMGQKICYVLRGEDALIQRIVLLTK
jgi:DNA-binding transcriptional ArsR family regulator